jgi:hypothetical protein
MLQKQGEEKTIVLSVVCEGGQAIPGPSHVGEVKIIGQPTKVQTYRFEASQGADVSKLWPKLEEELKAAGMDEKKVSQIRAALEQAAKSAKSAEGGKHAIAVVVAKAEGASAAADRFMIGVACSPASQALRAQLKLQPAGGLVVDSVFDHSPAKKAGIQPYDVLLEAGKKWLQKPEDLVEAVQQAAKDKKSLSMTLLRAGEKKVVEVVPSERPEYTLSINIGGDKHVVSRAITVGPGVITAPGVHFQHSDVKTLTEKLEQLSKQVQQLQEAVKKLQKDES